MPTTGPARAVLPDFLADGGKLVLAPAAPPPGLPPTPGPPGEPVFLLSRLLKKFARTPSLVAPATKQTNKKLFRTKIPFFYKLLQTTHTLINSYTKHSQGRFLFLCISVGHVCDVCERVGGSEVAPPCTCGASRHYGVGSLLPPLCAWD